MTDTYRIVLCYPSVYHNYSSKGRLIIIFFPMLCYHYEYPVIAYLLIWLYGFCTNIGNIYLI